MSRNFQLLQRAELERKQAEREGVAVEAVRAVQGEIPADAQAPSADLADDPEVVGLVQRVFLMPAAAARVVVFVAASNEENPLSVRAAEALSSRAGGAVCVVDADFTAPRLHRIFNVELSPGFSEALTMSDPLERYAHREESTGLTVIPAGMAAATWRNALSTETARRRMAELRGRFDHVLIEAPASAGLATATMLGQLADGVVLVVEAEVTRREVARNLMEELTAAGAHVLGAVLNNRKFPIPERIYRAF